MAALARRFVLPVMAFLAAACAVQGSVVLPDTPTPTPTPTPAAASCSASGDPHLICPDNHRFQFHGTTNKVYALFSTGGIHVNMHVRQGLRAYANETFIVGMSIMTASGYQVMLAVESPSAGSLASGDPWSDGEAHGVLANVHIQLNGVSMINLPTKGDFLDQLSSAGKAAIIANEFAVTAWGEPPEGEGERSARIEALELAGGVLKLSIDNYSPTYGYPHNVTLTVEDEVFSLGVARMEYRSAESKVASHAGMDYLEITSIQTAKKGAGVAAAARKILASPPHQQGGVFGTYCGPVDKRPAEGAPENEHEYLVGAGVAGMHQTKCATCVPLEITAGAPAVRATTHEHKVVVVASQVVAQPHTATAEDEAAAGAPLPHGRALLSLCETPTPTPTPTPTLTTCVPGGYLGPMTDGITHLQNDPAYWSPYAENGGDYCDLPNALDNYNQVPGMVECDECCYGWEDHQFDDDETLPGQCCRADDDGCFSVNNPHPGLTS